MKTTKETQIKIGSWYKYSDYSPEDWKKSGSMISKTASVHQDNYICNPVHISGGSSIRHGCRLDKYCKINWDVIVFPNVHIGGFCSIARNVQIGVANHPVDWLSTSSFQYNHANFPNVSEYTNINRKRNLHHPKTIIGADVWIGANVIIRSGVKIGHGVIIAAGAVVVKDIPPYTVVGGTPAKHIKKRFSDNITSQLLELKWWLLPLKALKEVEFDKIEVAIRQIEHIKSKSKVKMIKS